MNTLIIALAGAGVLLLLTRKPGEPGGPSVSPVQVPNGTGQTGTDTTKPIPITDPIFDDPIWTDPGVPRGRLLGDVDGDGVITENDDRLVLQIAAGGYFIPTAEQLWAADVNQDGKINSLDSLLIKHHLAGSRMLPGIYLEP